MYLSLNILLKLLFYVLITILLLYLNPQTLAHQIKHTKHHPGFPQRDEILIDPRYK